MRLIALTGGIGSGKSSVSDRLQDRGATVIDSDLMVRELQESGQPVFVAMVERWGDRIVGVDGTLNRPAVAEIVFGDAVELEAINKIVHPAVATETRSRVSAAAEADVEVVILDIPLLAETGNRHGASGVIVIDCPIEVAIDRLMTFRGFEKADAEARIGAQASREDRLELADFVLDNSLDLDHLDGEVERCWAWLMTLGHTQWPPTREAAAPKT